MRLSLSNPDSQAANRVRHLVATWCRPGIAWIGGEATITPVETCCILLETGSPDEIMLEDDSGCVALEAC